MRDAAYFHNNYTWEITFCEAASFFTSSCFMRSLARTSFPLFLAEAIFLNFCNLSLIEFLSTTLGLFCFNFKVGLFLAPKSIVGCEISLEVSFLAMDRWYLFSLCSKASLFRLESFMGMISTQSLFAVPGRAGLDFRLPRIFSTSFGFSSEGSLILDLGPGFETGDDDTPVKFE